MRWPGAWTLLFASVQCKRMRYTNCALQLSANESVTQCNGISTHIQTLCWLIRCDHRFHHYPFNSFASLKHTREQEPHCLVVILFYPLSLFRLFDFELNGKGYKIMSQDTYTQAHITRICLREPFRGALWVVSDTVEQFYCQIMFGTIVIRSSYRFRIKDAMWHKTNSMPTMIEFWWSLSPSYPIIGPFTILAYILFHWANIFGAILGSSTIVISSTLSCELVASLCVVKQACV